MPSKFSGMVVGGPLAGKHLEHHASHYNVLENDPPMSLSEALSNGNRRSYTYVNEFYLITGNRDQVEVHLWVLVGMRDAEVFKQIFEIYSQYEDLE